jgi:hypothetical protein
VRESRATKNNPVTSSADKAVAKYVNSLMPENVKRAKAAAMHSLYYGPGGDDPDAPGYVTAIDTLRDWIDSDMPRTLWYDVQSGYVEESEPEGFEDEETGEWIEPEWSDYYKYESHDIKRIVFGALVSDGGL